MPLTLSTSKAPQDLPGIARLGSAAARTPGQILTVVGTLVPLVPLELPRGLQGQAREQVARRQLSTHTGLKENKLSLRPFLPKTPGQKTKGGWNRVIIADPDLLHGLEKIPCKAVLPDYLTLPAADGIWCLATDEVPISADTNTAALCPVLVARLGPADGFTAQPDLGFAMLEQELAQLRSGTAPPRAILWLGPSKVPEQIQSLANRFNIPLVTTMEELTAQNLPHPQVLTHGELACDLRHNPLAARAQLQRRVLPWRWPLLTGIVAAGLWAVLQLIQTERLQNLTRQVETRTQDQVRAEFVPEGPILDARLQVSRALNDLQLQSRKSSAQIDPLDLMAQSAEVLYRKQLVPELLQYQEGNGLLLVLELTRFAEADALAADLRAAGLIPRITESRVSEAQSTVQVTFQITSANQSGETEK